MIVKNIFLLV